ncbi:hypothetical protein F3Y22_tig00109972pilonHSYRG00366 [Hibiscus syriacus]|uniref:Uncharacterized protein n=1 Tax=Hibiscus syriacus TaxID=106335 RepID=A0A6A3BWH4_HIBSY|nr:hypothetical protein F3Y22_tig00109972pilonHSYRG00366 [Hibiscus syriacus]
MQSASLLASLRICEKVTIQFLSTKSRMCCRIDGAIAFVRSMLTSDKLQHNLSLGLPVSSLFSMLAISLQKSLIAPLPPTNIFRLFCESYHPLAISVPNYSSARRVSVSFVSCAIYIYFCPSFHGAFHRIVVCASTHPIFLVLAADSIAQFPPFGFVCFALTLIVSPFSQDQRNANFGVSIASKVVHRTLDPIPFHQPQNSLVAAGWLKSNF